MVLTLALAVIWLVPLPRHLPLTGKWLRAFLSVLAVVTCVGTAAWLAIDFWKSLGEP
jgi:hypothetical protein